MLRNETEGASIEGFGTERFGLPITRSLRFFFSFATSAVSEPLAAFSGVFEDLWGVLFERKGVLDIVLAGVFGRGRLHGMSESS